jgi:hypothetical protein
MLRGVLGAEDRGLGRPQAALVRERGAPQRWSMEGVGRDGSVVGGCGDREERGEGNCEGAHNQRPAT